MNEQLPVSSHTAIKCHNWLQHTWSQEIEQATADTKYTHVLVSAIFCQETAQRVALWLDNYTPEVILQRCIFDASGDAPNTSRSAFPRNVVAFHDKYGDEFTDMLISEANKMRSMPQPGDPNGWGASHFLYKGYGIFQYDLQHVVTDETFFRNKLWYNFNECLNRLISELNQKAKSHEDLFDIVRAYNGAGTNAENYAKNVFKFMQILQAS